MVIFLSAHPHPALSEKGQPDSRKIHKWVGEGRTHRRVEIWLGWKEGRIGVVRGGKGVLEHSALGTPKPGTSADVKSSERKE